MASTAPPSSSTASTPDSPATTAPNPPAQKSFSCVLCAQRKVKCDKRPGGCANCAKARVPCIYKAPPPPRRRKKGIREIDTQDRLRLYEDALRKLGVDPMLLEKDAQGDSAALSDMWEHSLPAGPEKHQNGTTGRDAGVLVSGDGRSRYLENGLWTSLQGEFRDSKELLDESSDEDVLEHDDASSPEVFPPDGANLLFASPKSTANLRSLHPQPVQIFKLWQTYLNNVNPLVKVFHTPSIQQIILNASGNLDDVPKNVEALLFAMYSISLSSLGDAECDAIMGEPRSRVTQRFQSAAQYALANAGFLKTSDLMVLQAFVLFLLSLHNHDARVIWILTGVAQRIGQRLGLHRDGDGLGLPPFEAEMRRRLWWQVMFLEGFAEKLAGVGGNYFSMGNTKIPSNLNDSDLYPGMKELPKEHEGPTEMMFFLIRCHVGELLKRTHSTKSNFDGVWNKLSTPMVATPVKDRAIDDLEALFHRKFLQYCDHSIPWHFLCTYLAKAIIFMMRFMAHNPDQYADSMAGMPDSEKEMLFNFSCQVVSLQNMAYTTKEMQGFLWHINMHFQWKALIYLVSELRYRTQAPEADHAWKQVQLVYEFHPNFAKEVYKQALPIAVCNLTLKAWDAYLEARGIPEGGEPYFIQVLRTRKVKTKASTSRSDSQLLKPSVSEEKASSASFAYNVNLPIDDLSKNPDPLEPLQWNQNFVASLDSSSIWPDLPPLDPDQMNWSAWDNLLVDFQINNTNEFVADVSGFELGTQ